MTTIDRVWLEPDVFDANVAMRLLECCYERVEGRCDLLGDGE